MVEELNEQAQREKYVRGFGAMVLSRTLDRKLITAQRQGRVGFYTPSTGQEATQVGASMALSKEDIIYEYYRDVALMIHRGVPIEVMLDQVFGNSSDLAKGRQMPSHFVARNYNFMSIQSPVATNLPLAVGAAYAIKYRKKGNIVFATFGEGSSSTPDFHAAMNMAAVFNLPIVFMCENNGWAISTPVEKQTKTEIWKKADAYGMRGVKVDGNDFIETYKVTAEAVEQARAGNGPTLIEAVSYRMGPHSTSDDTSKYRTDEVQEGSEKDPIEVAANTLKEMGFINDNVVSRIKEESVRIVEQKFDEREKIPAPDPETMFHDVLAELTWNLEEQMREIL
ncbi:branched-chain alpha-keto acid dehydrogenase subunit E1 [uncultured archaeon]|nr:branched-chain alpha-keto acid dehydrogenase subunit E1 [uncultured archaeon]HKJ96628.1 thiamine pyrophosphate-dependent dehydrogenase E1 component subunit alpha [Thermoplasmataceae archaeon]